MVRCITPRPIPPYQSHFDLSARSGLDCETLRQNAKVSEDRSKTRMFRKLCEILTQDGLGWLRLTQTGVMWPSGCRRRTKSGAPACCCSSLPEDIFSDLKFFLRIHFDGKIFICVRSNLNLSVSIGKYAFRSVRIEISLLRWWGINGGIRLFAIQKSEGLLQAIKVDPTHHNFAPPLESIGILSSEASRSSTAAYHGSLSVCERIAKNPEAGAVLVGVEKFSAPRS